MDFPKHFPKHEFLRSSTAASMGITLVFEKPAHESSAALTAHRVLVPLRNRIAKPVHITSGYRNTELTEALIARGYSASRTSDHMTGQAVDIVVRGMSNEEVATQLYLLGAEGVIQYDQLIWYEEGTGGSCHVSYREDGNRMMARVKRKGVRGLQPWQPEVPPVDDELIDELAAMPHGGLLGASVSA